MWVKILLNYIFGYVKINIEGYYIERFINICTNQKIVIWNLKRDKSINLKLNVGIQDFKEIIKIAKKTQCKVKIEKKKGIPFIMHKYKKRKIFAIALIMLIFVIGISSTYIWNIEIKAENDEEFEGIYQDLEDAGLKVGTKKSKLDTKEIINSVRLKRDDIAWMGIEQKGTNIIVSLVKTEKKPEIVDEDDFCNIVSDKTGIITKINAQDGTGAVKVGDTVNVGTVLINGWIEGKYAGVRYVHAKGEIEAKVWYTKTKKILYNTTEETETGNEENTYGIKINNFQINLPKGVSKFQNYDTIVTEKKIKLFSDFYLPISIIKTTNKEIKKEQKKYTKQEAINLGIEELEQELDQEIQDKTKIVNKNVNTYEEEDGVEITLTYEVIENIGTNEKIVF